MLHFIRFRLYWRQNRNSSANQHLSDTSQTCGYF